jgi:hypothetical protein
MDSETQPGRAASSRISTRCSVVSAETPVVCHANVHTVMWLPEAGVSDHVWNVQEIVSLLDTSALTAA